MIIGSVKENLSLEKRISITPEIAKKYINLGFQISVSKNYGFHLGFDDNQYKNLGVKIFNDEKDLINSLDIIVQLSLLSDDKISLIKANQTLVGVLNPYMNKEKIDILSKKKINVFFTPHLIPMFRGILSTIYLETVGKNNAKKIYKFLKKYHKDNFFVKIAKFNTPIGTGDIMNTNFCKISICKDRKSNKVIIISTIDNLIKGASGQAVQNMNVAFGFNERIALK